MSKRRKGKEREVEWERVNVMTSSSACTREGQRVTSDPLCLLPLTLPIPSWLVPSPASPTRLFFPVPSQ